ncbi:hypothetical protein [Actinomadura sp. 9N407]|uniref:hypothetical protein n=1 Tax=Actinomadura sp. 9N407 TaxID=3375154 RepID=UPI003795F8F7
MSRKHEEKDQDSADWLVETQGVNAGGPVDKPIDESLHDTADPLSGPPDKPLKPGTHDDEMVGLPEQKPGYPGQQRSIDTS